MSNPLSRKLEAYSRLTAADLQTLQSLIRNPIRLAPHEDLIREGDDPRFVNVVLEGWACRYKQLEDGRRQIVALFLPGDMCDPCVFLLRQMSHSLGALTPVTFVRISQDDVEQSTQNSPTLRHAFLFDMLATMDIQREWAVSLGRRTSNERLAHLFCEVSVRLKAVGLTNGHECDLPLTQADLADALGLSTVHVNRTLQELRATGLVELRGKRLTIHNESGLRQLAMFNPDYLHLR